MELRKDVVLWLNKVPGWIINYSKDFSGLLKLPMVDSFLLVFLFFHLSNSLQVAKDDVSNHLDVRYTTYTRMNSCFLSLVVVHNTSDRQQSRFGS